MSQEKKVLIIDDNHAVTHALSLKLKQEGIVVDTAFSGEEGLQHIASFSPDLVLLDIIMPELSGTSMLEKYKTSAPESKTKFIILTNDDSVKTLSEVLSIEVTDFVSKAETPIDEVVKLVKSRLGI
jgi:DNA-binding response OmpR family regulator